MEIARIVSFAKTRPMSSRPIAIIAGRGENGGFDETIRAFGKPQNIPLNSDTGIPRRQETNILQASVPF